MKIQIQLAAALLLAAFAGNAAACTDNQQGIYSCSHVELVGSLTRAELGADDSGGADNSNDLWGWTDPDDGKEYVIIGMYNSTAFVDISDPANPVYLGHIVSPSAAPFSKSSAPRMEKCHDGCGSGGTAVEATETSSWQDVKVYDHYAYIVSEQDWFGMLVFDLHKLRGVTSPQAFSADTQVKDFRNAHNIFINEDTGFAYVVGNTSMVDGAPNFGGLIVYDLTDPANPALVTDYEGSGYIHDVVCLNYHGPDADYADSEICFASNSGSEKDTDPASPDYGKTLYYDEVTDTYRSDWSYSGSSLYPDDYLEWPDMTRRYRPFISQKYAQLTVLDVTDKDHIVELSSETHPNASYVHQSWPSDDHHYLFVNDELEELYYGKRTQSYTYDLSDLDAIKHVATYVSPNLSIDHNEYVKGRLLFQSNYESGLRILDAGDPLHLAEVGFFDSQPALDDVDFEGTWSNYPYFDSGIVAFSDIEDGLFLVRPKIEESDALGSAIAVDAALLESGSGRTYYIAVANNGPGEASEVDIAMSLPDGTLFNAITDDGGATCNAAGRQVRCQFKTLASCSTGLVSLALDAGAPADAEIVGMAAAIQLDPADAADNLVSITPADAVASVDTTALQDDLISLACTSEPVVTATGSKQVTAGAVATLIATASDEYASITGHAWTQLSGPAVSLAGADTADASFTAPAVTAATSLQFKVTATNAYGKTATAKVTVKVMPKTADSHSGGGALAFLLLGLPLLGMRRRS